VRLTRSTSPWRLLSWVVPIAAVALFVVLYTVAAVLFPGGTRADPTRTGFSFLHNYWCDVLDATSYGGRHNPGRPVALAAMVVIFGGLAVLWMAAPALFPRAPRRGWIVRVAGVGCALVAPWVGAGFHDSAIRVAAALGAIAFVTTFTALKREKGRTELLRIGGWCVLVVVAVNYFIWETGLGLPILPAIQKLAFAGFLTWVVLLSLLLRSALATR
jgi:hypothetical protein